MHDHIALESIDTKHGQLEKYDSDNHQVYRPQRDGKPDRDNRTQKRTRRSARADDPEKPLALFGCEQIGHERPEHGHGKEIENADPDEEHPGDDGGFNVESQQRPEHEEIEDEEVIDDRD